MTYPRTREIKITKKWIKAFKSNAEYLRNIPCPENVHPRLHQACIDGAESMVEDLEAQLAVLEREKEIYERGYCEADYGSVE